MGAVHIAGARRVTSRSSRAGDVFAFLESWESCSQGGGLADTASGGHITPWWHWAGSFGPPLGLSVLEKGQMGFWPALGPAGVAGEEGALAALQKDECEGILVIISIL